MPGEPGSGLGGGKAFAAAQPRRCCRKGRAAAASSLPAPWSVSNSSLRTCRLSNNKVVPGRLL